MYGRPMLGKQRMVTVATRIEPDELDRLKQLAGECGISVCAYLRELVRLEFVRAERVSDGPSSTEVARQPMSLVQ